MSPEQEAQRELLSNAAQDCQRQYPFVQSYSFNRFNQMSWFYRETATQAQRDQFISCYRDRVSELTKAAAVSAAPAITHRQPSAAAATVPSDAWVSAPIWKIGDEWSYRWESPRSSGTFGRRVASEETVDAIECYVVSSGRSTLYFRKSDFAWAMQGEGGAIKYKYTPPRQEAVWPLHVDRTWEQLYVQEQPESQVTENFLRVFRVESKERITVPAGAFDAFKVVVRNKFTNVIVRQYWLAPEVKNEVRRDEYYDYGIEKRELTAFKLN